MAFQDLYLYLERPPDSTMTCGRFLPKFIFTGQLRAVYGLTIRSPDAGCCWSMTLKTQFGKIHSQRIHGTSTAPVGIPNLSKVEVDHRRPSPSKRSGMRGPRARGGLLQTILTVGLFLLGSVSCLVAEEIRPNVVLIVVDDLGWSDLGCYGSKFHKTPNLDRLAAEGMRFTQAYAAAPVGTPTRVALLTGRYPQRVGITSSVVASGNNPNHRMTAPQVVHQLPLAEVTLAEVLKSAGYATASIGKWNLGGEGFGPQEQGFETNIAGSDVNKGIFRDVAPYTNSAGKFLPGLEQAPESELLTDRLAAEAENFITSHASKPFFLYLPLNSVHQPTSVKPETVGKYGAAPAQPNGTQSNPTYAAMIESMDEAIGRVVNQLNQLTLSRNTLVIVTSDNGGVCNSNGQTIPPTVNSPLRDGMGHLYEGGLRVPLIVKWPSVVPAGSTSEAIVSSIDWFPTIVDGLSLTSTDQLKFPEFDGVSLVEVLRGRNAPSRDAIYWHFPHYNTNAGAIPGAAVRSGDWKLIEFYGSGRRELFNLKASVGESINLVEEQPDIVQQLAEKLERWRKDVNAQLPLANPDYTPNLQSDDGSVALHAGTAEVSGIMLRYEPLPNKDTLGYWVRVEDTATFEFTLKRPGRFYLVPHVGCGTSGGSLVHFEVEGQTIPLVVPGTGHFQNFVPQNLGLVSLERAGRFKLKVVPQKKEGVAVMDIRRIELRPYAAEDMLSDLQLLKPFWKSPTVYRESVICVRDEDDKPATGKLLFPARKILSVARADGTQQFQEGTDFKMGPDRRHLVRNDESAIPVLKSTDLFMPKGARPAWTGGAQPAVPCALPHKAGDPETHVLFDNGHWFHDQQIEVTYLAESQEWPATVPRFDATKLPRTLARLKGKQKLTIAVSGDSISYGLNASGLVMAPPYMPMYPDLVAAQLRASYGTDVALFNRAVGGWGVPNGIADLDKLLEHQPDLVIIAYGMNDVGRRNPGAYKEGIQQMIAGVQAARPEAEIILVATMVGNDQWTHTPREMFPKYREALESLCQEGIALADLTSLWTEMLKRKRDCDLTGNGVNHPSDFGHRVYASAILSLLIDLP
ncbi:sulfatase-like hydrolase/transferase [Schlesneria sp. DSM 10557]|uniref:sulfatase-like hydrolase/transferase n=1 Tax=Schlesneria sp. DSM 10557 TaxID=3044399 RepID=UPI00359F4229